MRARLSRSAVLGVAAPLVALGGIGDRVSDDDVAFTLICLAPVALATWKAGRPRGKAPLDPGACVADLAAR